MSPVATQIFQGLHEIMRLDNSEENCKLNLGGRKQGEGIVLPANSDCSEVVMDPKHGHWKRRAGTKNTNVSPTSSRLQKRGVDGEMRGRATKVMRGNVVIVDDNETIEAEAARQSYQTL